MTVVGTAEVVVAYNSGAASAELKATTDRDLKGLSEQAAVAGAATGEELRKGVQDGTEGLADDVSQVGLQSGVNMREGLKEGANGIEQDMQDTGNLAGTSLRQGVKDGTGQLATDLSSIGGLAGTGMRDEVKAATGPIAGDLGKVGQDASRELETGLTKSGLGSKVSGITSVLGNLGLATSGVGDKADKMGRTAEKSGLSLDHLAHNAGLSTNSFLALGAGIVGVAGVSVKMAADFQSSAEHLVTDAGESQKALSGVESGMLAISAATGTSAADIVNGMYHIESAGYHGAQGLNVLRVAAEGAKVGGADLDTVSKTLTGTLRSYGEPVSKATSLMNQLIATVGSGDMRMQDLASSLGNVTPVAAAAHLSFAQVGGAIATMTAQNMSAQQATQDLANTIRSLQNPNQVAISEMQQLGLNSNTVAEHLGKTGLTGTIDQLVEAIAHHMGPAGDVLLNAFKVSQSAGQDLKIMLDKMDPSTRAVAEEFMKGSLTMSQFRKSLPTGQAGVMVQQFLALYQKTQGFNDVLKAGSPAAQTFNAALAKMMGGATGLNVALMLSGSHMAEFKKNTDTIAEAARKSGNTVDNWGRIQGTFNQKLDEAKASAQAAGIEFGNVLLPVFDDVASGALTVANFFEHDKTAAEALGIAVGVGLAVPVTRFAANTAKDFIGSLASAGKSVINFGAQLTGNAPVFAATQTEAQQTASAISNAASSMEVSAARIEASIAGIGTSTDEMAGQVQGQMSLFDASMAEAGAATGTAAGEVGAGMAAIKGEVTSMAGTVEAENEAAGLSFTDLIPGAAILGGIAMLASQFLNLGGSENQEAAAAQRVTSAKHAEASAITAAHNALLASESGYLGVQAAQQQVQATAEQAAAATKKYGASSLQAREAVTQHKEAIVNLAQAESQQASAQQDLASKSDKAVSKAKDQVTATDNLISAIKDHIQALQLEINEGVNAYQSAGQLKQRNQELHDVTQQLAAAEQQRTAAEEALQGASATAATNTLNLARSMDGLPNLTAAVAGKVATLGDSMVKLPRDVQMRLAADSSDAQEKISGVLTQLQAAGIGPTNPQVLKILGDSSNAQQALRQLTGLLNSIPAEFQQTGVQADAGLAAGITAGIPQIKAAAQAASNAATVTAKSTLKTHSPSKVFHQIGTDVGAGLAQGIDDSTGRVRASMRNLVDVNGKHYRLPTDLATPPSTPTLEAPGLRSTLRDAKRAPSPAMVSAEDAWVTGAQTVVTSFTNTAQVMSTSASHASSALTTAGAKVRADSSALKIAAGRVISDSSKLGTAGAQVTRDSLRLGAAAAKVATDSSASATKTQRAGLLAAQAAEAQDRVTYKAAVAAQNQDKAAVKAEKAAVEQDHAALKTAQAADATKAAASKTATLAAQTAKSQQAIASRGQQELTKIMSAITSGSQAQLNQTMSGITERHMTALVTELDGTHKKALAGMASQIETTWKQGMQALAQANEIASNSQQATEITNAAAAAAKIIADKQALSNDTLYPSTDAATAAAQLQLDRDQLSSDTTIGKDQAAVDSAAPGSLQESQDKLQLAKDQAAQTTQLATDQAQLSAAQAAAAAAAQTAKNTATIAQNTTPAAAAASSPTYIFNLEGSGQTTTEDWVQEIGIAMTIGTLPPAVPNPNLPGNQVLVHA